MRSRGQLECLMEIDINKGKEKPVISGKVSFEHVAFSYPQRSNVEVLKDVSFSVEAGQMIGLISSEKKL